MYDSIAYDVHNGDSGESGQTSGDNVDAAGSATFATAAAENAVENAVVHWHLVLGHSKEIKPKLYADGCATSACSGEETSYRTSNRTSN